MSKINWLNEILGGHLLASSGILNNIRYIIFVFILIILYISLNFAIEDRLKTERANQRELKHLKSEYISKSAKLQNFSKKLEVDKRLRELNSKLREPSSPAIRVLID